MEDILCLREAHHSALPFTLTMGNMESILSSFMDHLRNPIFMKSES
jgi:hypothetical protein